ncbi:MAG TPA: NAD(P)-dependent oxidoreductase [Acidimicrobiales bacterium]|nr:NAD(P)-dependent oxidoreductase [Acidimicrobiales bacterium]
MPENQNEGEALPRVGVIGLGDMGGGIATSLIRGGVAVTVCDVREEATAPFREGAGVAATPAALAAASDVVLVVVFNDAQVRAVLQGPDGVFAGAAPGTVALIISTIPTASVLELRAAGADHGVSVLDCGVSGGPDASASGELVCMIGGSAEEVERVRPVLDVISCLVLHMGPPGAGLAAKLARNLITYGSWLAAYEAQELAEAAGIDLVKLGEATRESDKRIGGASRLMFRTTAEPWPDGTDAGLLGAMRAGADTALKDLAAIRELGRELGVALPLADLTERRTDRIFGFPGE